MISNVNKLSGEHHHKIKNFFETYTPFTLSPGEAILHSYERPQYIFFLHEGVVKQSVTTTKGKELCLTLYKPGSFFPLMDGFAEIPNQYSFTAVLPCTGWKAPIEDVNQFIIKNPEVSIELNKRLMKALHGMLLKTEALMQGEAQSLIIQTLLTLRERFQSSSGSNTRINVPFTHQQLANMTGLSRETVTRELMELKKQNLVSVQGHMITLVDVKKLQALTQTVSSITVS